MSESQVLVARGFFGFLNEWLNELLCEDATSGGFF